jgi:NAD+ kinase
MTDVLVVAHHERTDATELVRSIAPWLAERGHRLFVAEEDAKALDLNDYDRADDLLVPGLALSIGGDGTMLRTVRRVATLGTPVIGVNVGALGYLTQVEPPALITSLDRYFSGDVTIEERMMLSVERVGGEISLALNEVVVEKSEAGHTVHLLVTIDGADFTTYAADGLIVATPTGSTAYSLSARGPIVSPSHRAILVTPVSPHMLFDRSLVLGPDETIEIEVLGHRSAELTIDGGRIAHLIPGDVIRCTASDTRARFVRFGANPFHQILKAKFGLSDR